MWPFSAKAKLIRELERLAFYNDKGIAYARHDELAAGEERRQRIKKIRSLVNAVGEAHLPEELVRALSSGTLSEDATGRYCDMVKEHKHV